jgi:hypothetical protein
MGLLKSSHAENLPAELPSLMTFDEQHPKLGATGGLPASAGEARAGKLPVAPD